jgi:hypothetical protein
MHDHDIANAHEREQRVKLGPLRGLTHALSVKVRSGATPSSWRSAFCSNMPTRI